MNSVVRLADKRTEDLYRVCHFVVRIYTVQSTYRPINLKVAKLTYLPITTLCLHDLCLYVMMVVQFSFHVHDSAV